jgi:lipopolysaccharide transport system ATP-binding protein
VGSLLEVGTGFHPELTGRENIYLNGAILGMRRAEIERKFDEIVSFAEIERFMDTPVKRYSSGMHVRLGFAVAAHLEPEVLLVDEVLAVGDAAFRKKCLGKMQTVTGEGRTVLFVSHSMMSIESLCHRVILLQDGKVAYSGDPAATIAHYLGEKEVALRSYTDLRTHPGRTPESIPIFQSVRLLYHREEETALFQVGDGVVFEMVLDVAERRLSSPRITIIVRDSWERLISKCSTDSMVAEPLEIVGRRLVRFHWDGFWLAPGTYSINLGLEEHDARLDKIFYATAFDVRAADVYGTGKMGEKPGLVVPQGSWEFGAVRRGVGMSSRRGVERC